MAFHERTPNNRWALTALAAVAALLMFAALGCGGSGGKGATSDQASTSSDSMGTAAAGGGSSSDGGAAGGAGAGAAGGAAAGGASSGGTSTEGGSSSATAEAGVVHLTDKGCVQFDPQWVSVAPGQSVTWVSECKAPVTIHVEAGAFAKTEFVVAPGARVVSGPAGAAKDYMVTTVPAACQGPALGARGTGPGVGVAAAAGH